MLAALLPMMVGLWLVRFYLAPAQPIYDGAQYFSMAYNMAKYDISSTSEDDNPAIPVDHVREPLPSFLMSLFVRATADLDREPLSCFLSAEPQCLPVLTAVSYVNVVCFVGIILIVYAAVFTLTGSIAAALIGSLIMATNTVFPSIARLCTSETPAALLVILHAWFLYLAFGRARARVIFAVASGLALGVLVLTKAVYLYWFVVLVLCLAAAMVLAWRSFGRGAVVAWLALSFTAPLVFAPWMMRNWMQFSDFGIAERGGVVLMVRAEFTLISWREYLSGYLFYTPYVGPRLAEAAFGDTASSVFEFGRPTAIETVGRHYAVETRLSAPNCYGWIKASATPVIKDGLEDCSTWNREVAWKSLQVLAHNWVMQSALTPLMFYREMFVGGCCHFEYNDVPPYWVPTHGRVDETLVSWLHGFHVVITLIALSPLFLAAVFTWLRQRQYNLLLFCSPAVFHFAFHATLTNGYPRFSEPLLPLLVCVMTVFFARSAWGGRLLSYIGGASRWSPLTRVRKPMAELEITEQTNREAAKHDTVTIFMATLNEIDGVKAIIPRISRDWYDEMIVVDGGSTDGTVEYLREHGINVLYETEPGVVNAYNQGFLATTGDIFITFTPDGNCIPELIPGLIEEARKGYDIVFVSRYLPPARSYDDTFTTGFGNWLFNRLTNILFNAQYTDLLGGFRAYRRSAVIKMGLHLQTQESWLRRHYHLINTWEVGGCVRGAKLKLATKEIPGDEPARVGGESKMRVIRNGVAVVVHLLYEFLNGDYVTRPLSARPTTTERQT
ncbi:MAG TPA: glycosyltransferase [Stellaceae bacterium]|nr:glycosyltransferase [Stellaceae bacterium]